MRLACLAFTSAYNHRTGASVSACLVKLAMAHKLALNQVTLEDVWQHYPAGVQNGTHGHTRQQTVSYFQHGSQCTIG